MALAYNLIMFAVDATALRVLWQKTGAARWLTLLCLGAVVALVLAAGFAQNGFDMMSLFAWGLFLHGTLIGLGCALMLWRRHKVLSLLSLAGSVLLAATAFEAFVVEPTWLEVTRLKIASKKIHAPLRIVVLADLQTDEVGDYERRCLLAAKAEKPDVLLFAGDYLQVYAQDKRKQQIERLNRLLRECDFHPPGGAFAVRGNAEWANWEAIFQDTSITLARATQSFDLGDLRLTCLGLRDSFSANPTIRNPQPDQYHIVLGHAPNFVLGDVDADLMLAGHTHGGQVRLPLLGPVFTNSKVPHAWAAGMTDLPEGGKLVVSRGLGMERGHAPRIRLFCRPQLLVIDLAAAGHDSSATTATSQQEPSDASHNHGSAGSVARGRDFGDKP